MRCIKALCLLPFLLLASCNPASSPVNTEPSYDYVEFEDQYYHFKFKAPILQSEGYQGRTYFIEDEMTTILIAHFDLLHDGGEIDSAQLETAQTALNELVPAKIPLYSSSDYQTTECQVAGLSAVEFVGACSFSDGRTEEMFGYCILSTYTPVLLCGFDRSGDLDPLMAMMREMARTYVDGTAVN